MKDTSWDHALEVTSDGSGLAGHVGAVVLRQLADRLGLTAALERTLTMKGKFPQLSRGVVLVSTAIAIALGATAMADIEVLGQLAPSWAPRRRTPPCGASWTWPPTGCWPGSRRPGRG